MQACTHLTRSVTFEFEKGTSSVELKNMLITEYPTHFIVSADLRGASRHITSKNSKGKVIIKVFSQDKKSLLFEKESFFNKVTLVKNSNKRFYTKVNFDPRGKHIVFRVDNF